MLPCLHRFCKECLIGWIPRGTKETTCPQCRQKTRVPDGDPAKFPTDFHLKELVEEDAIREKATAGGDFTCTCCDNQSPVVAKCAKCRYYLCDNGLAKHRQSANLQTHKIVIFEVNTEEVNDVAIDLMYCLLFTQAQRSQCSLIHDHFFWRTQKTLTLFKSNKKIIVPLQIVPLNLLGPIEVLLWPFPIESPLFPCENPVKNPQYSL